MECKKKSSSSSFTADLFGTKESPPSSSSGIFASIFPPPNKVVRRKSSICEGIGSWQKQGGNTKQENNKDRNSVYVEEKVEPCHLSSSLYYGGQDNYSQPSPTSATQSSMKYGGEEEDPNGTDSNCASRGNWWQGSLYY